MLLSKGVIRVSMGIPDNADFELVSVDDPYHCTSPADIAMFRRPLPSTNLQFLSAVMWDGRESGVTGRDITGDLGSQAIDATLGHAEASQAPTSDQIAKIVAFEQALSTAQAFDSDANLLSADGGNGGALTLARQPFYIGINDVLGGDPTGKAFDPKAMTVYANWENLNPHGKGVEGARAAIGRGEQLFNTLPIPIAGVRGLNDKLGIPAIVGTCTTCHDSPNAGDHSTKLPIDIGVSAPERRTSDMPLYTFRNKATGETIQTTDPGRAMITGKFADIGKFKGPILRGLAGRAPFFHNGMAEDLGAVVDFYNTRFGLNLTSQQKSDLVAFLKTL
jgi:cytochrome c peroxidase